MGRSIWTSDELTKGKQERPKTGAIGKFGIGFASVFEESEQVVVITRFFRETGEPAWRVDFTSIDKPFFTEPTAADIGTEVSIRLKQPLGNEKFAELADSFFLYVPNGVTFSPRIDLPTKLDDIPFFTKHKHSSVDHHILVKASEDAVLGNFAFRIRACFAFRIELDPQKAGAFRDMTTFESRLVVGNGGVRVFDQSSEYLKPGRRYVIGTVDESGRESYGDEPNRMSQFHVIVDFDPQNSPVLPSRFEIDIDADFSRSLRNRCYALFIKALEEAVINTVSRSDFNRRLRDRLLLVLFGSFARGRSSYRRRRSHNLELMNSQDVIEGKVIELYRLYCPVLVGSRQGEKIGRWEEVRNSAGRLLVMEELAKTDLFAVYVRKRNINEWILAKTENEFATVVSLMEDGAVTLISADSLYDEREKFLDEETQSPLLRVIRGDYAVIKSTIFGSACFVRLPGTMKGLWKREEAAARARSDVINTCPARVLLNAGHPLIQAINSYLTQVNEPAAQQEMRLLLDNFSEGVIEKDKKSGAKAGWNRVRGELARVTGAAAIAAMSFEELRPRNI